MAVVASDLEGTLSGGATWRGVGRYLPANGRSGAYRLFFVSRLPGVLFARLGLFDRDAFGHRWVVALARLFKGFTPEQLVQMGEWVVEHELWPNRREAVLAELEQHRRQGHRIVLASGTYQPVLEAFARRIGAEALSAPLEVAGGRATGRLVGPMNTGSVKAERLRGALNGEELVAAYGDTASDIPMLEMSRAPVVVCPNEQFKQSAVARGWRVIEG